MTLSITFTDLSVEEAYALLSQVGSQPQVVAEAHKAAEHEKSAHKDKRGRGRPPGSKKAQGVQTNTPTGQPPQEAIVVSETKPVAPKPTEQTTGEAQPTVADARTALQALNAKKGMTACQNVMAGLQVPRLSDLKPEQIPGFIAAVQKEIDA